MFLANTPEAASRAIGRSINMCQPDVSIAIKYLVKQGWIKCREVPYEKKGRPMRNYSLAVPVKEIITIIEKTKKNEANSQFTLVRKMRDYL